MLVWVGHTQMLVPGTPCGNMSEVGPTEQGAGPKTGSRASFHPVGLFILCYSLELPGRLSTWLISIPGGKKN